MTIDLRRRRFLRTSVALPIAGTLAAADLGAASLAFAAAPATDPYRKNYPNQFEWLVNSNADDIYNKIAAGALEDDALVLRSRKAEEQLVAGDGDAERVAVGQHLEQRPVAAGLLD